MDLSAMIGAEPWTGVVPVVLAALTKTAVLIVLVSVVVLVYWIVLGVISASLNGILATALYDYATTGQVPGNFNQQAIAQAFQPEKKRLLSGR